jgi:hypothetical protein
MLESLPGYDPNYWYFTLGHASDAYVAALHDVLQRNGIVADYHCFGPAQQMRRYRLDNQEVAKLPEIQDQDGRTCRVLSPTGRPEDGWKLYPFDQFYNRPDIQAEWVTL